MDRLAQNHPGSVRTSSCKYQQFLIREYRISVSNLVQQRCHHRRRGSLNHAQKSATTFLSPDSGAPRFQICYCKASCVGTSRGLPQWTRRTFIGRQRLTPVPGNVRHLWFYIAVWTYIFHDGQESRMEDVCLRCKVEVEVRSVHQSA